MADQGLTWRDSEAFLELFFGAGMHSLWSSSTTTKWDRKPVGLPRYPSARTPREAEEQVSYIPAQRAMSLRDGWTRSFGEYQAGDPYALREFSQHLHDIVQGELSTSDLLFPRAQRFHEALRDVVHRHVLGGWELHVDAESLQKRFVLRPASTPAGEPVLEPAARSSLPFLTWSAGQREFIPLLLGLYRLMPAGGVGRRGALAWAIIEEPEMGLHPRAIAATMAFVVELLRRQYRVVLSTHSTQVLDVVWGLRTLSELNGTTADVAELLDLHETKPTRAAAQSALGAKYRTYYFDRGEAVRDISDLDPMSDDPTTAGWGGLTAFSERVANVVARAVARSDRTEAEA